jgi:hypothetical protein
MNPMQKSKNPWPTKAAMEQIYEKGLWGNNGSSFFSGNGSHDVSITQPYLKMVKTFLKWFETPLSVCDLGCGDFNIGKELVEFTSFYAAVDIVPDLIEHCKSNFKHNNLDFQCLDISVGDLPSADCVIIRQVLQHLSNKEIDMIVSKLPDYKYVILTEHLPTGDFEPNVDIISGQGIRLKKQSGVNILAQPFNFKIEKILSSEAIDIVNGKGVIQTEIYQVF